MTNAICRISQLSHPGFPVTIYYAFKQCERRIRRCCEHRLETLARCCNKRWFLITGTWPIRTERDQGLKTGTNSLASSIVLVCRPRAENAPIATRREFITALKTELPEALAYLQRSNIAPVDLAQAAIGPGMAVYSRYSKVIDVQGNQLSVREALALINETLDEVWQSRKAILMLIPLGCSLV